MKWIEEGLLPQLFYAMANMYVTQYHRKGCNAGNTYYGCDEAKSAPTRPLPLSSCVSSSQTSTATTLWTPEYILN